MRRTVMKALKVLCGDWCRVVVPKGWKAWREVELMFMVVVMKRVIKTILLIRHGRDEMGEGEGFGGGWRARKNKGSFENDIWAKT